MLVQTPLTFFTERVRKSLLSALEDTGTAGTVGETMELMVSNKTWGFFLFEEISEEKYSDRELLVISFREDLEPWLWTLSSLGVLAWDRLL